MVSVRWFLVSSTHLFAFLTSLTHRYTVLSQKETVHLKMDCFLFCYRQGLCIRFQVMSPASERGGRIPGGDVCERCLRQMKRAKRSGSGRNSAKRKASREFRAPQQGAVFKSLSRNQKKTVHRKMGCFFCLQSPIVNRTYSCISAHNTNLKI